MLDVGTFIDRQYMLALIVVVIILVVVAYLVSHRSVMGGAEGMLGDGSKEFYTFINLYPGLRWSKVQRPLLLQLKKIYPMS